jgi:hypothetical protein
MPDEIVGSPAPAEATSSAPAPAATPQATPVAATPATPQAPATGAAPTAPEGYVPSYRLRETREAAVREAQQQWAAREAEIRSETERYRQQLHALVGATPSSQNPEIDAIRTQFGQLYPGLSKLEERAQQLQDMLERSGDLESQNAHYWTTYGRQTMDRLFAQAQESLGAPLTDEGKRQLHAAFTGFVQSSPELSARYANDPSLVQEFWKQFTSSFIDPVRRTAAAAVVNRAPGALPQDTPSGAPRAAGAPQLTSLDDRVNAAWATYEQTKR